MLIRKGVCISPEIGFFYRQSSETVSEKAELSQCEELNVMHCLFLLEVLAQSALFRSWDLLFK